VDANDEHRRSSGRPEHLIQVLERIKEIAENARFRYEADGSDGLFDALGEVRRMSEEALR